MRRKIQKFVTLRPAVLSFKSALPRDDVHSLPFDHSDSSKSMTNIQGKKFNSFVIVAFFFLATAGIFGQTTRPPMVQDVQVQTVASTYDATPSATPPYVQKTGSVSPSAPAPSGVRTLFPALAEVSIPGYSGVLVESLDGNVVLQSNPDYAFNPASNVKIATAYAVLKTFGPEFRFLTNIYTDGIIDQTTGTLRGNLYVSGKDMMFGYQHAISLAHELNKLGIRSVEGDLVVTDGFVMNYSGSPTASGRTLLSTMHSSKRSAAATRAWNTQLSYSGKFGKIIGIPGVSFTGTSYVQPLPTNLQLLFTHQSTQLKDIVKATLCYSNNFLSERLGDLVGGPFAVARIVQLNAVVPPQEFSLQTSSGLGYNRVTPNAMMRLLRSLRSELARFKMNFTDIMPVAGIDRGTLEGRFDEDFARGSVVGKTGTLNNTDGGVSALAGEVNTKNGKLLFVIFNQRGSVRRFRSFQNDFVSLVQNQFGGATPMIYDAVSLETRLARSMVSYPTTRSYGN